MSMNLKPAIRYQLREYLVSCLVFWAINALLIGIGFLVLSLNLGSGDAPATHTTDMVLPVPSSSWSLD